MNKIFPHFFIIFMFLWWGGSALVINEMSVLLFTLSSDTFRVHIYYHSEVQIIPLFYSTLPFKINEATCCLEWILLACCQNKTEHLWNWPQRIRIDCLRTRSGSFHRVGFFEYGNTNKTNRRAAPTDGSTTLTTPWIT